MADQYDALARLLGKPEDAARLRAMGGPVAPLPATPTVAAPAPPAPAPLASDDDAAAWMKAGARPLTGPATVVGSPANPYAPDAAGNPDVVEAKERQAAKRKDLIENGWNPAAADAYVADMVPAGPGAIGPAPRVDHRDGATFAHGPGVGVAAPIAPSAPVMISPGGRKAASWQVQEGMQVPKEAEDAAELGTQRRREAAGHDLDVAQKAGELDRAYLEGLDRAGARYEQEKRARAEQYASEYDQGMGRLEELRDQIRTQEVDPYKGAMGNSGLTKFLGVFAAAIGGYASAGRGPNMGMQAYNSMIDANLRQQEAQIAKSERGLKAENNFLGQLKAKFGDIEEAKAAARVAYLERAKTELAAKMAQPDIQGTAALAGYERAMGALDDELADKTMKFSLLKQDKVVRHDVNAPPVYAGGGGKAGAPDPLFVPTGPGGQGFQARSEKEAQAARGVIPAEQDLLPKLERLVELRRKAGVSGRLGNKAGYETEEIARIKSQQAQVALGLRELSAQSPGAMDKGMQDLAAQIQGDWTAIGNNPEAAADEFAREIRRKKASMMSGQGAQSEQQTLARDAKGNVVTQSVGLPSFSSPAPPMPKVRRAGE